MRFWVYTFLAFNSYWLSGQKSVVLKDPAFLLGFNVQPSITGSMFGWDGQNYIENKIAPRFVLNSGIQALIKVYRNWHLNINICYTELGYKETISNYLYDPTIIRKVTHKDYYIATNFMAQYRFKNMNFSLGFNSSRFVNSKKIEDGNINPYGYSGGNGYSFYSFNNGFNSQFTSPNSEWDKWLFGIRAGVGMQLKINDKLYFSPEAFISTFRPIDYILFWNRLHRNTGTGTGYYLIGLNLSLYYKLK